MTDVLLKVLGIAVGLCGILTGFIVLAFILTHPVIFFMLLFIFSLAYSIYHIGGNFNE